MYCNVLDLCHILAPIFVLCMRKMQWDKYTYIHTYMYMCIHSFYTYISNLELCYLYWRADNLQVGYHYYSRYSVCFGRIPKFCIQLILKCKDDVPVEWDLLCCETSETWEHLSIWWLLLHRWELPVDRFWHFMHHGVCLCFTCVLLFVFRKKQWPQSFN